MCDRVVEMERKILQNLGEKFLTKVRIALGEC